MQRIRVRRAEQPDGSVRLGGRGESSRDQRGPDSAGEGDEGPPSRGSATATVVRGGRPRKARVPPASASLGVALAPPPARPAWREELSGTSVIEPPPQAAPAQPPKHSSLPGTANTPSSVASAPPSAPPARVVPPELEEASPSAARPLVSLASARGERGERSSERNRQGGGQGVRRGGRGVSGSPSLAQANGDTDHTNEPPPRPDDADAAEANAPATPTSSSGTRNGRERGRRDGRTPPSGTGLSARAIAGAEGGRRRGGRTPPAQPAATNGDAAVPKSAGAQILEALQAGAHTKGSSADASTNGDATTARVTDVSDGAAGGASTEDGEGYADAPETVEPTDGGSVAKGEASAVEGSSGDSFADALHTELAELRARCAQLEAERAHKDVAMARLESRLGAKDEEVEVLKEELAALKLEACQSSA